MGTQQNYSRAWAIFAQWHWNPVDKGGQASTRAVQRARSGSYALSGGSGGHDQSGMLAYPQVQVPYETDQRLKSYLDTNQMHREQMCLAVMAIDKRFSDVRPRHPRGGPDGARDIEAIFNGVQRAFGAVGFVNQATDSDAHKKSATKKFSDDLAEAMKQQPQPEVFVFFTNVNLTVGEKDELVKIAKANGIGHAEVFDRERIRISLDSSDGLAIRFQYLGIPLSDAEQAAFFARWGDDIQGVIANGFGGIQRSLNRILFLQEARLPLQHFTAVFELDRKYSGSEIGHFRAFAWVYLKGPSGGVLSFVFGATDKSNRLNVENAEDLVKGKPGISESMCGGQWEIRIPDNEPQWQDGDSGDEDDSNYKYEPAGSFTSVGRDPVEIIAIRYNKDSFIRFVPGPRLLDINECMFLFHLNRRLAEKVRSIRIYANEYVLNEIGASGFGVEPSVVEPEVALFFSDEELSDPWVTLRPQRESTFHIEFSEQTPKRSFPAEEAAGSQS